MKISSSYQEVQVSEGFKLLGVNILSNSTLEYALELHCFLERLIVSRMFNRAKLKLDNEYSPHVHHTQVFASDRKHRVTFFYFCHNILIKKLIS